MAVHRQTSMYTAKKMHSQRLVLGKQLRISTIGSALKERVALGIIDRWGAILLAKCIVYLFRVCAYITCQIYKADLIKVVYRLYNIIAQPLDSLFLIYQTFIMWGPTFYNQFSFYPIRQAQTLQSYVKRWCIQTSLCVVNFISTNNYTVLICVGHRRKTSIHSITSIHHNKVAAFKKTIHSYGLSMTINVWMRYLYLHHSQYHNPFSNTMS